MSKQDRQPARTVAALEQRYSFGKSFAEVQGLADDARRSADEAKEAASNAHSEVIKLADSITLSVTGGEPGNKASIVLKVGEEEYSGEIDLSGLVTFTSLANEGETEINGNNMKTGKIVSSDGNLVFDLDNNTLIATGKNENGELMQTTLTDGVFRVAYYDEENKKFVPVFSISAADDLSYVDSTNGISVAGYGDWGTRIGSNNSETWINGSRVMMTAKEAGGSVYVQTELVWRTGSDGYRYLSAKY